MRANVVNLGYIRINVVERGLFGVEEGQPGIKWST